MENKRTNLGEKTAFSTFPAEITIGYDSYYLVKNETDYKLISRICPHAGGEIRDFGEEWVCPLHYWTFDKKSGVCTNVNGEGLACYPVTEEDGCFIVEIT